MSLYDDIAYTYQLPNQGGSHVNLVDEEEEFLDKFIEEMVLKDENNMEMEVDICPFLLKGDCKYGANCRNYHPNETGGGPSPTENDEKCNICLEMIGVRGREFGLLD
jgi:hypothetical protein